MAVRDHSFGLAALVALEDGKEARNAQVQRRVAVALELKAAELEERYLKSGALVFPDRVNWVLSEHYRAGLVERPRHGVYRITERGRRVLSRST